MEVLRFTVVAVAGVILDLAIAYALVRGFGLPLWLAATAGFVVAALANYIAHELWTFAAMRRQVSVGRAAQYLSASVLTLAARLVVVVLLSKWFDTMHDLTILIAGAGVSFTVNFMISKFLIFKPDPKADAESR